MSYSPAPLALDHAKPSPWNVEKAFVSPEYQDLWRGLVYAVPFWEGSGGPVNVVDSEIGTILSDAPWQLTPRGPGVVVDADNDMVQFPLRDEFDPTEGTIFLVFRGDGTPTDFGKFVHVEDAQWQLQRNGPAGDIELEIGGSGGPSQMEVIEPSDLYDGNVHLLGFNWSQPDDSFDFWYEGVFRESGVGNLDPPSVSATTLRFGNRSSDGLRSIGGTYVAAYIWNRQLSAAEHEMLADPYGLFRPNWDYVTAAAGTTDRKGQVSWAEMEAPLAPRRGQVSWAEMEAPLAPRKAQTSWAEMEIPLAPRRGQVSWAELETPTAPADRQAFVSWAEMEVPVAPRRGLVSWAELEVPLAPRKAQMSWAEMEVPLAPRRGQVSWAEFEAPGTNARALVSWAELEVPTTDEDPGGGFLFLRRVR